MNISGEVSAVRDEHRRLQSWLERLDGRIRVIEEFEQLAPEPVVPSPIVAPPLPSIEKPRPALVPPVAPISTPPPKPSEIPALAAAETAPSPEKDSLELRLGQVWLVRIGIVILLTGFVFLGNYAYHEFIGRLGPLGKLALLYLASIGIGLTGWRLTHRTESLKNYGRVLLAGGCAMAYYATYAAHFVAALRVIESPLVGGGLLLALAGTFAFAADRQRSQTLAVATIALSYYTAAINSVSTFSLFSNLVISTVAVALLVRHKWASISFLSLVGSYGSFAFWRFHQLATDASAFAADPGTFWVAVLFPVAYWAVHTVAIVLRRTPGLPPEARPVFLTLNNAACFALVGPTVYFHAPHAFWLSAVAFGAVLIGLAAFTGRRTPEESSVDGGYLAQGLALLFLGALFKFTGWQLALSFALATGTLISLGRLRHGIIYRFFAAATALVSTLIAAHGILEDAPHARLTAFAAAAILAASAWTFRRFFVRTPGSDWRVLGFTTLAGLLVAIAGTDAHFFPSAIRLLGLALIAILALPRLGLREGGAVGLPLALFGQLLLLPALVESSFPTSRLLVAAAFGLALIHQWRLFAAPPLAGRRVWSTLHVLIPLALTIAWAFQNFAPSTRPEVFAILAAGLLAYAFITKTRVLAAASLPLTVCAIGTTLFAIEAHLPAGHVALAIGLLAAQSLLLRAFRSRPLIPTELLPVVQPIIRSVSLLLITAMVFRYLPAADWFLTFTAVGFALFVLENRRPSAEVAIYAAAFGALALVVWTASLPLAPPHWPDIFGLAAFAVAQRIGRRRLPSVLPSALCVIATLGTWILLHRLIDQNAGGFLLTVAWSLLALFVLGGGFALRERTYRLLGLLILTATIARIFCVDVWQLDTLFRILSFLVLGGVLLALSFLYNRFAEALRKWM